MQNQDLQGISVTRSVVLYRVYHYHEEDITHYSNIQIMQDKYVWTIAKSQPLYFRFHSTLHVVIKIATIIQSEPLNLKMQKFWFKECYWRRS